MTSRSRHVVPKYAARVARYPAGATFGPRSLRDFELVWILEGSAQWTFSDPSHRLSSTHHVSRGDIVVARPGGTDSYAWDPVRPSAHAYMHFRFSDPLASVNSWPLTRSPRTGSILHGLCEHLLNLSLHDTDDQLERSQRALSVLLDVYSEHSGGDGVLHRGGAIEDALAYVRDQWRASGMRIVTLDELSAAANVSVGHLSRLFSATHGCGVIGALELVRLGRAAIELQRSNLTVDAIAQHCGFGNGYHFSRRFVAAYGTPPGRFRRDSTDPDALAPIVTSDLMPVWSALVGGAP